MKFEEGRNRDALGELHAAVTSAAPDSEQVIRVGVPAFRYRGKPLVSIGDARSHVALYIMYGSVLSTHAEELAGYETSNTVIRFDPGAGIPAELVGRLVRARISEIDAELGPDAKRPLLTGVEECHEFRVARPAGLKPPDIPRATRIYWQHFEQASRGHR